MNTATRWLAPPLLATIAAPADAMFLAFTPDPSRSTGLIAPQEGCYVEAGVALGSLTPSSRGTTCHSAEPGADNPDSGVGTPYGGYHTGQPALAQFSTGPLAEALPFAGPASFRMNWDVDPGFYSDLMPGVDVEVELADVSPEGWSDLIGSARFNCPHYFYCSGAFNVGPYSVPAGHRLRVSMTEVPPAGAPRSVFDASAPRPGRLLFGGTRAPGAHPIGSEGGFVMAPSFANSGIWLATDGSAKSGALDVVAGSLPWSSLLVLLGLAGTRRRAPPGAQR